VSELLCLDSDACSPSELARSCSQVMHECPAPSSCFWCAVHVWYSQLSQLWTHGHCEILHQQVVVQLAKVCEEGVQHMNSIRGFAVDMLWHMSDLRKGLDSMPLVFLNPFAQNCAEAAIDFVALLTRCVTHGMSARFPKVQTTTTRTYDVFGWVLQGIKVVCDCLYLSYI
jgi:hypothetical protein